MRVHKGLLLLQSLLTSVPGVSVTLEEAESPALRSILAPLVTIIVHHDVKEFRTLGFTCYRHFLGIFSLPARHSIFLCLLHTVRHSGLRGWTVTQLKDSVAQSLKPPDSSSIFSGPGLVRVTSGLYTL